MRVLTLAAIACLFPVAALADPDAILAEAAKSCAAQNNGVFGSEGAVRQIDLTGDGTPDILVDEALFTCSTADRLFSGPEGALIHLFANGTESRFQATGYETARWGDNLLVLLSLDGTNCNAAPEEPCIESLTWSGDRFLSVRPAKK